MNVHVTRTLLGALICLATFFLAATVTAAPKSSSPEEGSCSSYATSSIGDAFTLHWDQATCDFEDPHDVQTQLCWKPVNSLHTLCVWKSGTIVRKNEAKGSYQFTGKDDCTKYEWQVNYWDSEDSKWLPIPHNGDGTITTLACKVKS